MRHNSLRHGLELLARDYQERPQYEGPTIVELHNKNVKARKIHPCAWCRGVIISGEKYLSMAYTEDGTFRHDHIHLSCRYGGPDE